jgi:large repetitive protein
LLGNGDGTFQPQQRFDAGFGSNSIAAVDVNGDGVADLVTANRVTHDVSVLLGNGTGNFQPPQRFIAGTAPRSMTVADLNGDGKPDLVTGNSTTNTVSVLLHR